MQPTEEQKLAIESPSHCAVIASAGTGKTSVLKNRYLYCKQELNVPLYQILAFTFTDKATKEMKSRIMKDGNLSLTELQQLQISTIHSFCRTILVRYGSAIGLAAKFHILDAHSEAAWTKLQIHKFLVTELENSNSTVYNFYQKYGETHTVSAINQLFNTNLLNFTPKDLQIISDQPTEENQLLYKGFLKTISQLQEDLLSLRINTHGIFFNDLEVLALRLLKNHPDILDQIQNQFRHILVDEFQDISPIQGQIIEHLHNPLKNILFIVGDPKQAIYGFRQSRVELFFEAIKRIKKLGGKTIELTRTFRTPSSIQKHFNKFFPKILNTGTQNIYSETESHTHVDEANIYHAPIPQDKIKADDLGNLYIEDISKRITALIKNGVSPNKIAIISRTRKLFSKIENKFQSLSLPVITEQPFELFLEPFANLVFHCFNLLKNHENSFHWFGLLSNSLFNPKDNYTYTCFRKYFDRKTNEFHSTQLFTDQDLPEELKKSCQNFLYWKSIKNNIPIKDLLTIIFYDVYSSYSDRELQVLNVLQSIFQSWHDQEKQDLFDILPLLARLFQNKINFKPYFGAKEGINLLTIHGSKGLEYEHVFILPAKDSHSETKITQHSENEGFTFKGHDFGQEKGLKYELSNSDAYTRLLEKHKQDELNETKRLIYVALTRLEHSLYIYPPCPSQKLKSTLNKNPEDLTLIKNYEDWLYWLSLQEEILELEEIKPTQNLSISQLSLSNKEDPIKINIQNNFSKKPTLQKATFTVTELETFHTCAYKFYLKYLKSVPTQEKFKTTTKHTSYNSYNKLPANVKGNLIHEILQFYSPQRENHSEVIDKALVNQSIIDETGAIKDECLSLIQNLNNNSDVFKALFEHQKDRHELEFTIALKNFYLTGQIDKITEDKNNIHILDYKTHKIPSKDHLNKLFNQFQFQLMCYAVAAHSIKPTANVTISILFTDNQTLKSKELSIQEIESFKSRLETTYDQYNQSLQESIFKKIENKIPCQQCIYGQQGICKNLS